MENEQTEAELRVEMAGEFWPELQQEEGKTAEVILPPREEPEPEAKQPEPDPWDTVPQVLKQTIDSINSRLQGLDRFDQRIKQAESRVGSLDNRLRDMKTKPPSDDEIKKALETDDGWKEFKEDFPSHADAIEKHIAARVGAGLPTEKIAAIREELETDFQQKLSDAQKGFELKLLKSRYPNHIEISKRPDFMAWLAEQPPESQSRFSSWDALDGIALLDDWSAFNKKPQEPANIVQERQERLRNSTIENKSSHKATKPKTEAEMSVKELREKIEREVWPELHKR